MFQGSVGVFLDRSNNADIPESVICTICHPRFYKHLFSVSNSEIYLAKQNHR